MCCVTKATHIHFIDGKKVKRCRVGLTNNIRSISHHIMVMNGLNGRHTYIIIMMHEQKQFQETMHMLA